MSPVSDELFADVGRDITLCYQTYGDPAGDPLLLVMGLGGPMTWWDPDFCALLVERGFFVIRFDNRDIGRSTKLTGRVTAAQLAGAFIGVPARAPYSLADMADDGFGLLDHLGIGSAHVCGVSMGGMIAQTMAVSRPERVRSLVSIMSTTGKRWVGAQHPSLFPTLLSTSRTEEEYVASAIKIWGLIGSPAYQGMPDDLADRARTTYERGVDAAAIGRQMLAVVSQVDRTAALGELTIPAAVIHGLDDKMVNVSGGRATAAAIPGAELVLVRGMGHDLPPALWATITDVIRRTADRAGAERPTA